MTPESRKRLRELALAATPGPWILEGTGNVPDISYYGPKWENPPTKDEEYIAAANPQAIISLLDENERMREALKLSRSRMEYLAGNGGAFNSPGLLARALAEIDSALEDR